MGKLSDEILADMRKKKSGMSAEEDASEDAADQGDDEEEEGDYAGDEAAIAGELKSALDDGDEKEIAAKLKAFLDVCVPKIVDKMKE